MAILVMRIAFVDRMATRVVSNHFFVIRFTFVRRFGQNV